MAEAAALDRTGISFKAHRLLELLLGENPRLEEIMRGSKNEVEALVVVRRCVLGELESWPATMTFYQSKHPTREESEALGWSDIAAMRLLTWARSPGLGFRTSHRTGPSRRARRGSGCE